MAERLRILVVAPHLGTFIRDQVTAVRSLVDGLDVAIFRPYPLLLDPLRRGQIEVSPPKGLRTWSFGSPWLSSRFRNPQARWSRAMRFLASVMSRGRYDVVHAHFLFPQGWLATRVDAGPPVVLTAHGFDVYALPRRSTAWHEAVFGSARRASRLIAVSERNRDLLVAAGVERGRIRVIPNGYEPSLFPPMGQDRARTDLGLPDGRYVIAAGPFVPIKRFDWVIRALKDLPKDVRALLVGDGPERSRLAALAKELGVASRVVFPGSQPHAAMCRWIAAANVLAIPSSDEGSPTVVPEAFAMGRPVVATRVGGIPQLLRDDVGRLVEPERPDAFAASLGEALVRPWNDRAIREYGTRFSWTNLAHEIVETYRQARAP